MVLRDRPFRVATEGRDSEANPTGGGIIHFISRPMAFSDCGPPTRREGPSPLRLDTVRMGHMAVESRRNLPTHAGTESLAIAW
jgi:hypothetical protein